MIRQHRFNLSDWALKHRSLVWFLLIVSMLAGLMAYRNLGREEDPNFTIKVMVISAFMPGATIQDTIDQVTDRIETKLEELDALKFTRSVTMPAISSSPRLIAWLGSSSWATRTIGSAPSGPGPSPWFIARWAPIREMTSRTSAIRSRK